MQPSLETTSNDRYASAARDEKIAGRLQILDPLATPNWDALVMALPGCTPFHSAGWARVLEETYNFKPLYFAHLDGTTLKAVLPMMEVNSWLTGRRGVALPFSDACGALSAESSIAAELLEHATKHGRENGWKYWEYRDRNGIAKDSAHSDSFYSHVLDLSPGEEKLLIGLAGSLRTATRKAEKSGVSVERSLSLDGMRTYYQLHLLTRQKHGVPPQSFDFFANFHRNVIAQNLGFVTIARHEDQPIAASVYMHLGTRALYKWGASDEKYQNLRGANLVMWHSIQWFARAGFSQLDFGRTDKDNEGLRRFKLGWGANESLVQYFRYNLNENRFYTEKDRSPGWREKIIQRLPIPVSRMIGGMLYKHVA